jgi:hypothetical protein
MMLEIIDSNTVIRTPLFKSHRPIAKMIRNESEGSGLFFVYAKEEKHG